jgi:hypothetical protein
MTNRLALVLAAAVFCGGCVVREIIVRSDPPGAAVYINGHMEGKTPLTKTFDFYGARELTLRLDGYQTAAKVVTPAVPWYEYFPLDFISEIMLPVRLHDRHEYSFTLEPLPERAPPGLLERADRTRSDE